MNVENWLDMGLAVDLICCTFFIVATIKIRNVQKQLNDLREDLILTMKNPQAARRKIKR